MSDRAHFSCHRVRGFSFGQVPDCNYFNRGSGLECRQLSHRSLRIFLPRTMSFPGEGCFPLQKSSSHCEKHGRRDLALLSLYLKGKAEKKTSLLLRRYLQSSRWSDFSLVVAFPSTLVVVAVSAPALAAGWLALSVAGCLMGRAAGGRGDRGEDELRPTSPPTCPSRRLPSFIWLTANWKGPSEIPLSSRALCLLHFHLRRGLGRLYVDR